MPRGCLSEEHFQRGRHDDQALGQTAQVRRENQDPPDPRHRGGGARARKMAEQIRHESPPTPEARLCYSGKEFARPSPSGASYLGHVLTEKRPQRSGGRRTGHGRPARRPETGRRPPCGMIDRKRAGTGRGDRADRDHPGRRQELSGTSSSFSRRVGGPGARGLPPCGREFRQPNRMAQLPEPTKNTQGLPGFLALASRKQKRKSARLGGNRSSGLGQARTAALRTGPRLGCGRSRRRSNWGLVQSSGCPPHKNLRRDAGTLASLTRQGRGSRVVAAGRKNTPHKDKKTNTGPRETKKKRRP